MLVVSTEVMLAIPKGAVADLFFFENLAESEGVQFLLFRLAHGGGAVGTWTCFSRSSRCLERHCQVAQGLAGILREGFSSESRSSDQNALSH